MSRTKWSRWSSPAAPWGWNGWPRQSQPRDSCLHLTADLLPRFIHAAPRRYGKTCMTWEPVAGFEPAPCRLQEVWPSAPRALPAPIAQPDAGVALSTLDFSGWTFHDAFHATGPGESALR